MEDKTTVFLLNQIKAICSQYVRIGNVTGENFNLFRILGIESSEVGTHTPLLMELLNPEGQHGQKDKFLSLFLEELNLSNEFDLSNVTVGSKFIGYKNTDCTQGGQIDIFISNRLNQCIIIENKIDAGDQPNQLLRYVNYSKNFSYGRVYYLTKMGDEPTEFSTNKQIKNGEDYHLISYSETILNWLDECRKEVAIYPLIRETITLYINLIKYLTGKSINVSMEKDIVSLIVQNPDYLKSSFLLVNNLGAIKKELMSVLSGYKLNKFS